MSLGIKHSLFLKFKLQSSNVDYVDVHNFNNGRISNLSLKLIEEQDYIGNLKAQK